MTTKKSLDKIFNESLKKFAKENKDIRITKPKLQKAYQKVLDEFSDKLFDTLIKRQASMLKESRNNNLGFEARLYYRWADVIDGMETLYIISTETGESFYRLNKEKAIKDKDFLFEALVRIHSRSCLIFLEILELLKVGLPDGAYARWRSLHELSITAMFLADHGNTMAERFLDYDFIETYKIAKDYQKYYKKLKSGPPIKGNLIKLAAMKRSLCNKHGKDFYDEYRDFNWVSGGIGVKRTIRGIEESVKMNIWRPHYRLASGAIHVNSKGLHNSLAAFDKRVLVAGKSNYGLADPAQNAAIAILQINSVLLMKYPSMENLATINVIQKFSDKIKLNAYKIQKQIEKEEHLKRSKK